MTQTEAIQSQKSYIYIPLVDWTVSVHVQILFFDAMISHIPAY